MEAYVSKLEEFSNIAYNGPSIHGNPAGSRRPLRDDLRTDYGCGDCDSSVSKYFSGSSTTDDLYPNPMFSYHRDDLKSSFTIAEKQELVSAIGHQCVRASASPPYFGHDNFKTCNLPGKSEMQCLMKFHNDSDPMINHAKWTSDEEKRLLAAVAASLELNWCGIADSVSAVKSTRRTPLQCLQHYQLNFNKALIRPTDWSEQEDQLLLEAVELYGTNKSWQHISNCLEGRAASQCHLRWKRLSSQGMKSGPWSDVEERKLVFGVVANEKKSELGRQKYTRDTPSIHRARATRSVWQDISENVPKRDEARCREKWTNVLDPKSVDTSPFTSEEDELIRREALKVARSGNSAVGWSSIARKLVGRTDSQCLRRWKEICGPSVAKIYVEQSKKRRSIAVPQHARGKASRSSLDSDVFVPVLKLSS